MMLKTALVQLCGCVEARVIVCEAVDISEVQTGNVCFFKDAEIGIVRKHFVNLVSQRTGHRSWSHAAERSDQLLIAGTCFKHDRRPTVAARVKVHHQADVLGPWMLLYK